MTSPGGHKDHPSLMGHSLPQHKPSNGGRLLQRGEIDERDELEAVCNSFLL